MDANGNQRKRAGRVTKSANINESISSTQNTDSNEVMEVSAVAISPTLEEAETSTSNAPVAECRRSSRKKIIKFDVRDLLNKNRKTHKIQIEARIDSNAPTTSKASAAGGAELANSKSSTTVREDLLSKQKTFLEKSAIFRRYSISQEHKPPPPPLPIPHLLGKPTDSDEANLAGSSTSRRLSRTQEFFSNVMIKPKQTTSLIVAQIESNTPSSTATTKRKTPNKSIEIYSKTETDSSPVVQQKRRGRPAKFKTPTSMENTSTTCVEDVSIEKKQITPEKAKNWKEYKACLAQSEKTEIEKNTEENLILIKMEETSQSDLSKSDDDGNFSGFQTSKDDISCDTPNLDQLSIEQNIESEKNEDSQENVITKNKDEAKMSDFSEIKEIEVTKLDEILDLKLDILHKSDSTNKEQIESAGEGIESGISKKQEIENKTKIKNEQNLSPKNLGKQDIILPIESEDEVENAGHDVSHSGEKLFESSDSSQQPKHSKRRQLKNENNYQRKSPSPQYGNKTEKTTDLIEEQIIPSETEGETTTQPSIIKEQTEFARNLNTPDLIKATKIIDECTPETKLTPSDILLITSQLPQSQPTTPSEETMKSFSRTSSSSESENSSYSSDPASSTSSSSSSSSRSYKSGDKLRISLKRISLPKSPSTSSQTSTSEELNVSLNQTEVLKKKPPIAKRSKRLQKKFVNMLENKNDTGNIDDDCLKQIKNEEEIKQEKQICKEIDNTMVKDDKGDYNLEILESSEKTMNAVDKSLGITEFAVKKITEEENEPRTQSLDSLSIKIQEQTNQEQNKDTSCVNKRKSSRNRTDNNSDNKNQNVEEDEENLLNINSEKDLSSTDVMEKSNEKLEESSSDFEIHSALESEKNEDAENKPKRKTRNSQLTKHPERKLKNQTSRNDDKDETTNKIEQEIELKDQMEDIEICSFADKVILDIKENDKEDQEKYSKTTIIEDKNIQEESDNLSPVKDETTQSLTIKDSELCEMEKLNKPTKVNKTRSRNKDESTLIESIIKEENLPSSDLNENETISKMIKQESSHTLKDTTTNRETFKKATQDEKLENLNNKPTKKSTSDKNTTQDELKYETSQILKEEISLNTITESEEVITKKETKKSEEKTKEPLESPTKEQFNEAIRVNSDNKTSVRNKSQKTSETPETVKSKAASSQKSSKTVTGKSSPEPSLKSDIESESNKKTTDEEIINSKAIEEERPSTPKRSSRQVSTITNTNLTNEAKESLTTKQSVTSSPKSIIPEASLSENIDELTVLERSETIETLKHSTKRKSLRNQKDKNDKVEFVISVEMPKSSEVLDSIIQKMDSHDKEETNLGETVKVPKRKGRKSRFKNLHTPDIESETDSSNGKNTPLDEIMQQKTKEKTILEVKETLTDAEDSQLVENTKESKEINENTTETNPITESTEVSNEIESLKESSKSNLSSSQIQNVSIETNTLLDILRRVQSNTEAALKANNKPLANDVQNTEQEILPESSAKETLEDSAKKSSVLQEPKRTSPVRSNTNSPAIVKRMPISPTRSESASPLTLKKVAHSPSRSDSSSPLTLKKVTRRYERRSRRGEDVAHKTLEETFAEIAAESSKAVLAAKEFDNYVEEPTNEENPTVEINVINTENSKEKPQVIEIVTEVEKPSQLFEDINLKPNDEKENAELNLVQSLENIDKPVEQELIQTKTEVISSEKNVDSPKCTKITPGRKGRKPKNTLTDAAETKEELEKLLSSKINADSSIPKEIIEEKSSFEIQEEINIENKKVKTKKAKEATQTEKLTEDEINYVITPATSSEINIKELSTETPIEITKSLDDKNDNKSNKKSFKKRDSFKSDKTEVQPVDSTNLEDEPTTGKEDDVRTPKQPTKKRDISQTKSETKSTGKKTTKKTKNDEDDSSNLQKDDTSTKSITPPLSKRGRKPKNQQDTAQSSSNSKKKNKKELTSDNYECDNVQENINPPESEAECSILDKSLDEKLAKKKRQKKLKEAFEAALTDDINKSKEQMKTESSVNFGLTELKKSPPSPNSSTDPDNDSKKITCVTPVEAEEEPDPLKDIEKFIADGVNLLKKDYKLDENSVDDVITSTPANIATEVVDDSVKPNTEETENQVVNTFETPADTPINTPSATPPPKSPTSLESSTPDENSGVRRSHRIKLITKTPKALVGRGLVRDKERFSIKDDVETKSHYTLDDHLTDLAEVEAKNAKFLKEMEERLSNFQVIKENEYLCERVISREAKKMICDCFLTQEEEERGELGCGEDCLNRLLMIECGPDCNVKERCTNKRFQKLLCSPCRVFRTEKKGFGIMADIEILPGEFIMEYVGEVIDTDEFEKRRITYSQDKNRHYYFMALRSDAIIDATIKGNISRFINHSCDPNAETQKWTVNGELRIGFFSRKSIMPGEEITFNYQYQRYGREAQRCYCESANCRGWIGQEPTSDEGEQIDDYEEDESDDEEEADTSNLLVQDDDEDSDASVADPEEVQKQLEMAAAQAEVELAPLQLLEEKNKQQKSVPEEGKSPLDITKSESDEDSKSKFKKLLSKMAEKVAAKQKQTKREQKLQRKKKSKESSTDLSNKLKFLEDPDIEDEVEFLRECGLKNQSDTLRLSRLMVRAKLVQTRLNLLEILRKGDLPCRRLFLDYHGLRLLHGWMSEDAGNMQIRLALLQTLETLPIANKTVLTDSKVMQVARNWCGNSTNLSPNEDSSSSNSNSQDVPVSNTQNFEEGSEMADLQKLAQKLISTWEGLPEIFRIPKKERIEQMKEHEREADRQYAANAETEESNLTTDRYRRDRFGRGLNTSTTNNSNRFLKPNNGNPHRPTNSTPENNKNLSKAQRREMFAAKVARDEAEKRLAEERREFETKCRFFGLDPKKTRPQDIPFCVNPATGQWFSIERKPITTPPSYAHVQVPVKPKSTDPNDYQLPAVCSTLPQQWKYAITPQGKIYYYHIKHRIPQWEPPSALQLQECEMEGREEDSESELTTTGGEDSSDDDDDVLIGMDAAQLKAYIDRKVEIRRQKRYQRLVDERSISPRREEDRIYNQIEVRKYKENKEKIRKRKEEIRRRRAEALRQTSLNMCTLGSITETNPSSNKTTTESDDELGALPIQDYLLSSDEEVDLKAEVNSPLMDKIVEGDKIVDELDALTTKRQLKRPLPPHRDLSEASTSSASTSGLSTTLARQEYKKRKLEKKEKRKPKEQQDAKYRKTKEKFRCEIAGIIVHHLKPYRKDNCTVGRIQSNEDFNHLARKLTHFVMIKELKYCESVGQTLVVTESVKSKSREFIKKYMAKYGEVYIKPINDPNFKDIPFTL
ncbi:SET domain containing 2 [Cochliomyia hominivorax]